MLGHSGNARNSPTPVMTRFRISLLFLAGYVGLIVLAARAAPAMPDLRTLLLALLPYQAAAVLLILCAVVVLGGWRMNGFGRLRLRGMVWLLPGWIVLAAMFWNIAGEVGGPRWPQQWDWLLLLGVPLLIAIGEEVLFRGVLLRQAMKQMSVTHAMLFSAALFGLFHLVNGVLGQGIGGTLQQVAFAFLVGFFLAPIALRAGNIWPLIIWHWLWNVAVFTSQAVDVLQPMVLVGIAIQVAVSGWMWRDMAALQTRG